MPSQVAKEVLRQLEKNWKSFFKAIKAYRQHPSKFTGRPKLPKYKDKVKGRFMAQYYNPEAISQKWIKQDVIKLAQLGITLPRKGRKVKLVLLCQDMDTM